MRPMTFTDVRTNFRAVLEEVITTHERVVIPRSGGTAVVIIALEDLESMEETIDILSDPKLVAAIEEGEQAAAAGDVLPLDEVLRTRRTVA